MSNTAEPLIDDIFTTASKLAKKLRMKREDDMTTLRFSQPVMIVTETGIVSGTIRSTHGREDDYRYDTYSLDEITLCSYTFNRLPGSTDTETIWEETPTIEMTLPEGAILYAGRIPKSKIKPVRLRGYHY